MKPMELMELIELKELMELIEVIELLETCLWNGGYDWIERADGASGIGGKKEEIRGIDTLVGSHGN